MLVKILLNNICVSILVSLKNLSPIYAVIKMEQERVIIISIVEYSLSMIIPLMIYMKTNTIKKVIT